MAALGFMLQHRVKKHTDMEVQVHGATASLGLEGLHPMDEAFAMGLFSIVNAF